MDAHVLVEEPDGNIVASEIWDSPQQLEAFGGQLMPVLADLGIEFSGDPDILKVHHVVKR